MQGRCPELNAKSHIFKMGHAIYLGSNLIKWMERETFEYFFVDEESLINRT